MGIICGLLGANLAGSFSRDIHEMFGATNYRYYEMPEEKLDEFFKNREFHGINVTMPYKTEVMKYLDYIDDEAKAVGSVNTIIKDEEGKLKGYNTDVYGFEKAWDRAEFFVHGKKVLILGTGGASKAVEYVLKNKNAGKVVKISRTGEDNYENLDKHYDADFIVNATPVGMEPFEDETPVDLKLFPNLRGVFDLIYNPLRTELILNAEELNIPCMTGLYMLVAQAKRADELFSGGTIDDRKIDSVYNAVKRNKRNLVLVGMPGSGKSTIGQVFAKEFGLRFYDTDQMIYELTGKTPEDILNADGEEVFRTLELELIKQLLEEENAVIATGGGVVTIDMGHHTLKHGSCVVYIKRALDELDLKGRPLSKKKGIEAIYNERKDLYERFSDTVIANDSTIDDAVERITDLLKIT